MVSQSVRVQKKQMWPIVARCRNVCNNHPFLVGLYYSTHIKPIDFNEYLKRFIDEVCDLDRYGFILDFFTIPVSIKCITADTPARNSLMQTAKFNGYYGCDRCTVKGNYVYNTPNPRQKKNKKKKKKTGRVVFDV